MISERTTLIRLAALCLALAPLPAALAYSETDLATLEETGSCSGCDLAGADLYEADLFQADLSLSDLSGADLTGADLTLANLTEADLRGAILDETNLSGANLAKAILDKEALAGAIFDSERTRTTLGFKDLKLGMNVVEVAQYCSIEAVHTKTIHFATTLGSTIKQLDGTCFDNADMPLVFKFSSGGTTGVLNFLQVGLAPYTEQSHRKFIDLLAKKYKPARSYSAQDVAAFNNNRDLDIKRLHTIFANGQVTLSVVGEDAGLQMLLSYRDIEHGRRFLKRKGGPAPVDLTHLPPITADLYKLVGNYKLKGIGAKGTSTNHGRIDTAYLEIDAFENELAGELVISGHGMSGRFRITGIEKISGNRLTVQLEPVTGTIPDGRPLRMSLEFSEDGDSFTGKWTNWFRLKNTNNRRPDDFKGSRSQSFWQTAMSHNRIDMYQAYLRLRPGGIYSAVARSRITALGGTLAVPSAPTASIAATASPSTPTTTITTTETATVVDPLVGIWHFQSGSNWTSDNCYLAVGMNDQGVLVGKSWETHQKLHLDSAFEAEEIIGFNIVGVRDITIGLAVGDSYTWETTETLPLPLVSWTKGDLTGRLYLNMDAQNARSLDVNNRICRKLRSESKNSRLKKLSPEEALALELPPELLEGFPSPFATQGQQVTNVSEATASTPATPSAATPVDPLVGIWKFAPTDGVGWGYFIVGMDDQDRLAGFQWQNVHSETFGFRETTIKPLTDGSYRWHSDQSISLVNPSFAMGDAADGGKFWVSENENSLPTVTSSKELFLQWRGLPPRQTLQKIALEEALALELPPEVPQDFPSPFATEGPQVASVPKASASAAPSTPATTTKTVDPLVGIWTRASGFHGNCHFIVGQRDDGTLTAVAFQRFLRRNVIGNDSPIEWGLTDAGVGILARAISIKRTPKGAYSWQSSDNFQALGLPGFMANPPKKGSLSISKDKDGNPRMTSNRLCVEDRAQPSTATYRKLSLDEAIAMELPSIAQKDFPSPFVTQGPQVASVPKATASASAAPSTPATTTAAIDPLVGIWHWQGGMWGFADSCYLAVGINDQGVLVGKSWETHQQTHLDVFSTAEEIIGFNIVGVRDITIGQINTGSYTWETKEALQSPGEYWTKGGLTGKLHLNTQDQNVESLDVNNRICRKLRSESKNSRFKKLPLEEALALELPPELLQGFPSPFQDGTQWSGDAVATEIIETTENQGTTSKTDDSDRR